MFPCYDILCLCERPQTRFPPQYRFPDHFILSTEACADPQTSKPPRVSLGDWSRGNQYSQSIIEVNTYSGAPKPPAEHPG